MTPGGHPAGGIFLYGGVQTLRFHDIMAHHRHVGPNTTKPYQISSAIPATPLKVKPSIYLDSIYNSVFDSTAPTTPMLHRRAADDAQRRSSASTGSVQNFSVVSITQSADPAELRDVAARGDDAAGLDRGVPQSGPIPAGYQFFFNVVGTTGRTSLQALAVNNLNVGGKSTNFTAQRDMTPVHVQPQRHEVHPQGEVRRQRRRAWSWTSRGRSARSSSGGGWAIRPALHRQGAVPNPSANAPDVPVPPGHQYGVPLGRRAIPPPDSRAAWSGQEHRLGQGRTGQLHHSDVPEPGLRTAPAAGRRPTTW